MAKSESDFRFTTDTPYLALTGELWGAYNQGSKLRGVEGQNAPQLPHNAPRLLSVGAKFCSLFKIRYVVESLLFAPVMATFAPRFYEMEQ